MTAADRPEETVRKDLAFLVSPRARDVALSESLGGNAGPCCYALNLQIDGEGLILGAGNNPQKANAALRVYVPYLQARRTRLHEVVVEVAGEMAEEARRRLTAAAWLWNLYRDSEEKAVLDRFIAGEMDYGILVELLRTKYPKLPRALTV